MKISQRRSMDMSQITVVNSCAWGLQQQMKFSEDLNYPEDFINRKHTLFFEWISWTLRHLKLFSHDVHHFWRVQQAWCESRHDKLSNDVCCTCVWGVPKTFPKFGPWPISYTPSALERSSFAH